MAKQIPLTQGQFAIVDDEDFEWLNLWKWCAMWSSGTKSFRAVRTDHYRELGQKKQKLVYMHRQIMNYPKGLMVDHVAHGTTLDNRRCNLRIATAVQNMQNKNRQANNKVGFKGVREVYPKIFYARICVKGKDIYLGCGEDPFELARSYDRAAIKYFGEFALLNFPREEYING